MRRLYIYLSVIVATLLLLPGCNAYESAQKAYGLGEYEKAAGFFDQASRSEANKTRQAEEFFLLGECYRHLGMPSKAAAAYNKAVRNKIDDDEALLRMGDCFRAIGRFDQADEVFAIYAKRHATDHRVLVSQESSALGRESWTELQKKPNEDRDSGYVVTPWKEINSRNSDYCPIYVGDGFDVVYFTSMRPRKKKSKSIAITGQPHSTVYMTKVDGKGKWTVPTALEEPFGQPHIDDGAAYVTPDGHTMLFTRCPMNADAQEGSPCQAYEMQREGGRWSDPKRIIPGGDSTMMVAHPTLSPDGGTLYFVSDRKKGGLGGLDIWTSKKAGDGTWGRARNLGAEVNSGGDEMFPSMRADGTLYFSSDGHRGYGRLDIFKAVPREGDRWDVSNMGMPINSASDDFGITFMGTAEEGLLSSNRGSTKGFDNLYNFYLPPVILTIEGWVGKSGKRAFMGDDKGAGNKAPDAASQEQGTASQAQGAADKAQGAADQAQSVDKAAPDKAQEAKGATGTQAKGATGTQAKGGKPKGQGLRRTMPQGQQAKGVKSASKGTSAAKGQSAGTKNSAAKTNTTHAPGATKAKPKFVPLPGGFVRIVGSDGTNVKIPTNDRGSISFVAERDVRYIILAGAPGYANKRVELNTEGLNKTQTLSFTSLLDKVVY